jgi:hypothetical protein
MSCREADELLRAGQISDGATLMGLLLAIRLKYLRDNS